MARRRNSQCPRGAGRLCGRPPSLRHSEGVVARRTETRLHSRGNAVSPSGDTFRDQLTVVVAQNRKTIRARLNQIVDEAEHPSSRADPLRPDTGVVQSLRVARATQILTSIRGFRRIDTFKTSPEIRLLGCEIEMERARQRHLLSRSRISAFISSISRRCVSMIWSASLRTRGSVMRARSLVRMAME
jgi:hypothetical protein